MFDNRHIASDNLNCSYFSKKYHNCDTFTLLLGLIILTFWHLFNFLYNMKFVPRFLPNLVSVCNFLRMIPYLSRIDVYVHHIWFFLTIIRLSSDIGENLGPKRNPNQIFSICHWNLKSISKQNYLKIFLLRAYSSLHKFDFSYISETYLDSTTSLDDSNLETAVDNLLSSDQASNSKRGVACLYYKSSLALRLLDVHYPQECLIYEILIGGKLGNFIFFYRSAS